MRSRIIVVSLITVVAFTTIAWFVWQREVTLPSRAPHPDLSSPPPELPTAAIDPTRQPLPSPPTQDPKPVLPTLPATAQVETNHNRAISNKLYGRVVSAVDHSPVGNATIGLPSTIDLARSDGDGHGSIDRENSRSSLALDKHREVSRSDADGRFSIEEPPQDGKDAEAYWNGLRGSVLVAVTAGFGPAIFHAAWLSQDPDHPLEIPIVPGAVLKGRLINRSDTERSPAMVYLTTPGYEAGRPTDHDMEYLHMLTVGVQRSFDDEGYVTIESLPPGVPFTVEIWSSGVRLLRDPAPLVLEAGKAASREWRLGAGCLVRGHVVDQDGEAVPGQVLWISQRGLFLETAERRATFYRSDKDEVSKSVTTAVDGSFSIPDVSPGNWWLGVAAEYHSWEVSALDLRAIPPIAEHVEIREGDSSTEVTLRVHRGIFISGQMVDPDGKPASGFIMARSMIPGLVGHEDSQSRSDGTFALGPLEPGDYEVSAYPTPFRNEGITLAPSTPMVVAAGRDDVRIELLRGGTIRPKAVRATTGKEVPAAFCLAASTNPTILHGCGNYSPNTLTQITGLPPDTYDLAAITPDGMTGCLRSVVLGAGQVLEDLRVPVEPGARVSLRYLGHEPEYAQVGLWIGTTYFGGDGIHEGTTRTMVAPRGKVIVRWKAGNEQFDDEVDLAVGEMRELSWPRPK
jgi:hypothetical protein